MENRWYLSQAPIARALVHLCVPMAAGFVVGAVANVLNSGFIGSLHDTELLAAITFGTPLLGFVVAFGGVFGIGAGALVGRLLGAAEKDPAQAGEVKHVASFAFWSSVITGAVVGGLGLAFLHPIVSLLGAHGAAAPATRAYAAVLFAFVPVLSAAFCLEQLVRAEGAARSAMTGIIVSTIANLLLDVLFILVLRWGVAGAALSVGVSNLISVGYWAFLLRGRLSPRWFTGRASVVRPVLGVGVGSLLQSSFLIVTALVLNNLAARYGDAPLAAMGIAVRLAEVPEFLVMGVTLGVLPLLAYAYGKGDRRRLTAAMRGSGHAVAGIVLIFAAAVLAFRRPLFAVFSTDHAVLTIGATIIAAQLVATAANGFIGLITSYFQAVGRSMPATVMSTAQGVLFIPIVLLGRALGGLTGIIWAQAVTEGIVLAVGAALLVAPRRTVPAYGLG